MPRKGIRKQVDELTLADLDGSPAWEFALDEEGRDDQDEATVRPHVFKTTVDPAEGMLVVRARFRLADGSAMTGYLTPPSDDDSSLGAVQPVIVTGRGQVGFWHGSIAPRRAELDASYTRLGKSGPSEVFPVSFSSDVPIEGGPVTGEIAGFMVLEDWRSGRTRVLL